ncbi:unnamed protein product, partial [Closterium sp. NIES-53]
MAEFSGTHFLFKNKRARPWRLTDDGWYTREPASLQCHLNPQRPLLLLLLLHLLLLLLLPRLPLLQIRLISAPPPAPQWGQPEASTWDESAVGADDDVAANKQYSGDGDGEAGAEEDVFLDRGASAEDDDGVESWWRDAPREKMPIPTHKPSQHKRQAYTCQEKLRWLVRLELAASVSEVARESGIHHKCLTEWKSRAEELKASHAARCRLHGRGRSSWYRPMELK